MFGVVCKNLKEKHDFYYELYFMLILWEVMSSYGTLTTYIKIIILMIWIIQCVI